MCLNAVTTLVRARDELSPVTAPGDFFYFSMISPVIIQIQVGLDFNCHVKHQGHPKWGLR